MGHVSRLLHSLLVLVATTVSARADWPNFRGPNHDGISAETGFRSAWEGSIPKLWEREVGSGFSSFAVVGNHVFTGGTENKQQTLLCLNADTGDVIWKIAYESEYPDGQGGDGPRATPTVDGDRVYMLGARGLLLCVGADTGKEIWKHQFNHVPQWGYSGSVLIEGDMAIAAAGKDQGDLAAYDKKSGKEIWKRVSGEPVGYATPYPFTFEGTRYICGFTGESAMIVEAATGREVWRQKWKTDWEVNAAAPIYHDGHLFLTSGYSTGSGVFKLKKSGDALSAKQVWQNKSMLNKFQSCILHEEKLYSSDQKALVCLDFMTGKEAWRKPRIANGTLVLADGHLLLLTEKGQLQIAKISSEDFKPATSVDILDGRCWTVPVLDQGRLYARNLDRVVCVNLKP